MGLVSYYPILVKKDDLDTAVLDISWRNFWLFFIWLNKYALMCLFFTICYIYFDFGEDRLSLYRLGWLWTCSPPALALLLSEVLMFSTLSNTR
jgi:hypothetical protein